ncbi:MAG: DUF4181 domain-containing protein [Methanobacterium paludis]|nr:DUF4181 domain-containing protein [Methanobacterium paludis]
MIYFILLGVLFVVLAFFSEIWLRKKWHMATDNSPHPRPVNKTQLAIETVLVALLITLIGFFGQPLLFAIIFIVIFTAVRMLFEWKYAGNRKDYLITLVWGALIVLFLLIAVLSRL